MEMTVDRFVIYYQMVMVIILGIVAFYIITYACRGGAPLSSIYCGIFFIIILNVASYTYWYCGAAITYAIRGGNSSNSLYCGFGCVTVSQPVNDGRWSFGITLFYF